MPSAPTEPEKESAVTNVDQLRHRIDRGRTGDKVSYPDPAAAPLGTDDEAAGTPPAPDEVRTAWRAERAAGPAPSSQALERARDSASGSLLGMLLLVILVVFCCVTVLGLALAVFTIWL